MLKVLKSTIKSTCMPLFVLRTSLALRTQRVGNCYLEVSFGTTGVDTWCHLECYLECYLVLPGVTWSVTWCYLGVAWRYLGFFYFEVVLLWSQNVRVPQTQTFGQKSIST